MIAAGEVLDAPRLSEAEAYELRALEQVIAAARTQVISAGRALSVIRERRLYRATHGTFEAYCLARWHISDRHARRMIAATETAEAIDRLLLGESDSEPSDRDRTHGSGSSPLVLSATEATERAVRELTDLPPEQAAEAYARAVDAAGGEVPTAKETRAAAAEVREGKPRGTPRQMLSSDSSEWYTPELYWPAIAFALGGEIGLDPCADPGRRIPARRHLTQEDDGLTEAWVTDTLYINPPWAKRQALAWAAKLRAELDACNVGCAVGLWPGRIDTDWWREVLRPDAVCIVAGRVVFVDADGEPAAWDAKGRPTGATFPVTFTAHNIDVARFAEAFSVHGEIWVPYWRPERSSSP